MNKSSAKCKILNKVMVRKGVGKVSTFRRNEINIKTILRISKNTFKNTPENGDEKCDEKRGPGETVTHGGPGGEV